MDKFAPSILCSFRLQCLWSKMEMWWDISKRVLQILQRQNGFILSIFKFKRIPLEITPKFL